VTSTVINRVVTSTPSLIFGTLGSNGNVVLVNQSGITVGAGAIVDTAGFTASALRMSDSDAIDGRLRFGDDSLATGGVSVQGSILARSGDAVLIGANVDTGRDALIQAPNGSTILVAGQKIEMTGRGLEGIRLQVQAPADSAVNLGTLSGDAVGMFAGTLKHSGTIQANAVSTEGGKVVLKAVESTRIDGMVQASALGQKGGSIMATARQVQIDGSAVLDASGAMGGGEVLVGGGYQGRDARLSNAQSTLVAAGAQLKADATVQGDGGTVVVWADGATRYEGSLSARGGSLSGNGGRAEVSGKGYLDFRGLADLSAVNGVYGALLLDPFDLTVDSALIANLSSVGTLTLQADNDITVSGSLTYSGANPATLIMNAGRDINDSGYGASISGDVGSPLTVRMDAARAIVAPNLYITTYGGDVDLTATTGNISVADVITSGGNVVLTSTSGDVSTFSISTYGATATSATGNNGGSVNITAGGTVTVSNIDTYGGEGSFTDQTAVGSGGSVTITANGSAASSLYSINSRGGYGYGGSVALASGGSVSVTAGGDLDLNGDINTNASVTISSSGFVNACPDGCISIGSSTQTSSAAVSGAGGYLPYFYATGNVSLSFTNSGAYTFDGTAFEAGSISISTPNGSISQIGAFNVGSLSTTSQLGTTLTNSANAIGSYSGTNTGSGGISLTNIGVLSIGSITTNSGNITVDNTGALTTFGLVKAGGSGTVSLTAHSPITIGTGGVTAGGNVTLTATTPNAASNITLNGNIQSSGGVTMSAYNSLTQNSYVYGAQGVSANTTTGAITFGPNGYSAGSPLTYADVNGAVSAPLVPASSLAGLGGSVTDFLDQFLAALDEQATFSDDPFDPRNREQDTLVVEGQICTP